MTKKTLLVLLTITALAFVLRIYNITSVPPSPDWDEASLGYNAYSILKTGKDEFGNYLPLSLRSFNDYKPAFYAYTAIPSVALFGLNIFAVRLPSVLMGVLTVIGVFFLAEYLRKSLKQSRLNVSFSLLVSFLLSISPWHLQFSRGAFEVNSGLFLLVWGAVFLLWGTVKPGFLLLSAVFYSLSLYAYHSSRIFVPLFLLGVFIIYRDKFLAVRKYLAVAVIIGIIMSLPALFIMISPEGRQRLAGVSIYTDQTGLLRDNVIKIDQDNAVNNKFANLLHNRRLTYVERFIEGYLWHFTPIWLFLNGDGVGRHHAPDMGLLYLIELPFVLLGLYKLLGAKEKEKYIILLWFLLPALAGAPTNQVPHAIRSYYFLPVFQIFTALGIISAVKNFQSDKIRQMLIFVTVLLYSANFTYYLDAYFRHFPYEYAKHWQYGYKEAIAATQSLEDKYHRIIFSGKLEQPYIYYLFYTKYDPSVYLAKGGSKEIDFNNWSHLKLDKYEFKLFNWNEEINRNNTLYIGRPADFPGGVKIIKTISYPNGEPAMVLVEG